MSEPLTHPDCDLRGLPFMPLDVVRLVDSDLVALSTGDEFKAAVILWCKAWLQVPAARLPVDDRVLAHLTGTGKGWGRLRTGALRGFIRCSDGRFYHPVIAEKANEAWERRTEWQEQQHARNDRQQRWRERVKELSHQLRERGVTPPRGASLSTLERLLVDAKPSTQPSTVDGVEIALTGTGTGTGTGTVSSVTNVTGGEPPPADPDKVFWDGAKAYLGKSKSSLIGKWIKDHGRDRAAAAIAQAQVERAVDPTAYIEGILRKNGGANGAWASPC